MNLNTQLNILTITKMKNNTSLEELKIIQDRILNNGQKSKTSPLSSPEMNLPSKVKKKRKGSPEYDLSVKVSNYLKETYPNVLFHFDIAGLNLTKTQRGKLKAIQGCRGYPDLFLAAPRGNYAGLFIELKIETPWRIDGTIRASAKDHLKEQEQCLKELKKHGYLSYFAWDLSQIKLIIDSYLKV